MKKETYAGKIGNGGTQKVEALYKPKTAKSGSVKKGEDLRTKNGK